ncbi:MAG: tetraacyldisaccharide 4'-kinase [Pseudolabrys sp.]|nr:tetraacyldisaccharide 4'-kinase [Pseudolabrys sp.]
MRDPGFWWEEPGLRSALLSPFGMMYGAVSAKRMQKAGARCGVPVLCVGNFTLGGAGKTPTAIMIAQMLTAEGLKPFCLTRGYGGSIAGPKRVDLETDSAATVGDEALLLARTAPTIVARDRVAGANAAVAAGADVIVMDDGLQNGSLAKDFSLAVVDARRGIGNGCVFPAGPLRAPLDAQLRRSDALLVIGDGAGADGIAAAAPHLTIFRGRLMPDQAAIASLQARKVLAFAGIGDPEKFFATAIGAGLNVVQRRSFADHHRYNGEEAGDLIMQAEHDGLSLLTTEKDRARMAGDPLLAALAAKSHVLPVTLAVNEGDALRRLVLEKVRR